VRGFARTVGGCLLQTGVDFPRRLGELAPGRHDDGAASRGSVDCTGNDRYAARRQLFALGCRGSAPGQHHAPELDSAAGFEHAAQVGVSFGGRPLT